MQWMRPIALMSDFGTRDPYVASMKGVIASRTTAPLFDLSHEIPPYDVLEAAWFLKTAAPHWPAGTIFVAVVDPGVGSSRRIVAAGWQGRLFLAPDNGLLSLLPLERMVSVENEQFFLPGGSTTFHGRDRFAPAAAALANGTALEELGPPLQSIVRLDYERPRYGDTARGTIVAVDRFGNLITDIERARVPGAIALRARNVIIDRMERNYADAEPGAFLIVGSSGFIEISVANGSAAERLQLRRLDRVEVWTINA
jgi:S-adenosylmethionine hydrolase